MKFVLIIFIVLLAVIPVSAQWQYGGKQISGDIYGISDLGAITDGEYGVFVAWKYYTTPYNPDIYVQHVDSAGYELWTPGGVLVCTDPYGQYMNKIALGDSGDIYVSWVDLGRDGLDNPNVYAQRIGLTGELLWGELGLPVVINEGEEDQLMISDNSGGILLSWTDVLPPDTFCVIVQRLDSQGVKLFGGDGLRVVTPRIDGEGLMGLIGSADENFIVIWMDSRSDGAGPGIYAQKLDPNGQMLWDPDGIPVVVGQFSLEEISFEPSVSGGFYTLWTGLYASGVFAQYVDSVGTPGFGPSGITLDNKWYCFDPKLQSTGNNQVLAAWMCQLGIDTIFANLIDDTGNRWPENRVIGINTGGLHSLIESDSGEFIFSSDTNSPTNDYRGYKYSLSEGHLWGDTGISIGLPNRQGFRHVGVSDMSGGSFFAWQNSQGLPVFINRIYFDGWVAPDTTDAIDDDVTLPQAIGISNYPNPFNSSTLITFEGLTGKEVELRIYDIEGRLVDRLSTQDGQIIWTARNKDNQPLPSGLYFAKIMTPLTLPTLKMIYLK
jgi:hypothetical protein